MLDLPAHELADVLRLFGPLTTPQLLLLAAAGAVAVTLLVRLRSGAMSEKGTIAEHRNGWRCRHWGGVVRGVQAQPP